jgi:hypothetical protein
MSKWRDGWLMSQLADTCARIGGVGLLLLGCVDFSEAQARPQPRYVGNEACRNCHESEYARYREFAKKAHSFDSIKKMQRRLTAEEFRKCFECHTTGYGKPGGFRSEHETPNLRNAGCETCHGPGGLHVRTGRVQDIKGNLTAADCEKCHNKERIQAFKFVPLIFGGGH